MAIKGDIKSGAKAGDTIGFEISDPASDVITNADKIIPLTTIKGSLLTVRADAALTVVESNDNPDAQDIPVGIEFPLLIFKLKAEEEARIERMRVEFSGLFDKDHLDSIQIIDHRDETLDSKTSNKLFDNKAEFDFDYSFHKGDEVFMAVVVKFSEGGDDIRAKLIEIEAENLDTADDMEVNGLPISGEKITISSWVVHSGSQEDDEKYGYRKEFSFEDWEDSDLDEDDEDEDEDIDDNEDEEDDDKDDESTCQETDDGIDYYEYGESSRGDDTFEDSCNGDVLEEYWCNPDRKLKSQTHRCFYGCEQGACIKGDNFNDRCNDTDGNNIYQKGEIYYFDALDSPTEECVGDSVVEHWCDDDDQLITESFVCEDGCLNGACICDDEECQDEASDEDEGEDGDNQDENEDEGEDEDRNEGEEGSSENEKADPEKCPNLKDYPDSCALWYLGRLEECSGEDCIIYKSSCEFNGTVGQYMVTTNAEGCPSGCQKGVCENSVPIDSVSAEKKLPVESSNFSDPVITDYGIYKNPFPDTGELGDLADTNFDNIEALAAAELWRRNISKGHQDGRFLGFSLVNRAEAATFLIRSKYKDQEIEEVTVEEVKKIHTEKGELLDILGDSGEILWSTKYIVKAWRLGIIKGYKDDKGNPTGKFGPRDPVKTGELLVMMQKLFELETNLEHSYNLSQFPAEAYYLPYLGLANKYQLFPRLVANIIYPGKKLSRYEVAVAIYQYFRFR